MAHGDKVQLPTERKEITVSPNILADCVGTYELSPTFSIVMALEGGQLMNAGYPATKVSIICGVGYEILSVGWWMHKLSSSGMRKAR